MGIFNLIETIKEQFIQKPDFLNLIQCIIHKAQQIQRLLSIRHHTFNHKLGMLNQLIQCLARSKKYLNACTKSIWDRTMRIFVSVRDRQVETQTQSYWQAPTHFWVTLGSLKALLLWITLITGYPDSQLIEWCLFHPCSLPNNARSDFLKFIVLEQVEKAARNLILI